MTVNDFRHFYRAIHDYPPFDWQEKLLERVVDKGWPATIDLPTSSGKTSAIDVAVFHLALQAGLGMQERTAALRTFFVIDRRAVVDEASEHASKIATALRDSKDEIVADVARSLRSYGVEVPLKVSTMRGGMYRDSSWADEPNQPLVCVSTVDQVGSRLLFRGYQVGDSSRPVHAGLIGNDSLMIVDEAHLSKAFLDTLGAVQDRYMKWAECPPAKPVRLVQMSATMKGDDKFDLKEESIEKDEKLAARLRASKPAELRTPKKKFEDEMISAARELAAGSDARVVGVIANTVGSARAIFTELEKTKGAEAVLLIGRNRPFCSQELWRKYKDRIAAKEGREIGGLLFVVATQTVEVGANIDFDALVTESAPLNSLRQRFGRLNRLGRPFVAKAVIVLRPKGDVVYGASTENTWKFLSERAPMDFGVMAMKALLEGLDLEPLNAAAGAGPLVFPAHLEFWVQTNPTPSPDPEVAPFLHGEQALDAADVQVVWRGDLGDDPNKWKGIVSLAPPLAAEALALPVAAVRRWLKDQEQEVTDLEGVAIQEAKEEKRDSGRSALRWRGAGKKETKIVEAREIRPGDTIIVPSGYGGADQCGWNPGFPETRDIGDEANKEQAELGLRKPRIRLGLARDLDRDRLAELLGRLRGSDDEEPDPSALKEIVEMLRVEFKGTPRIDSAGAVITWPLQKKEKPPTLPAPDETDEDDDSSFREGRISLKVHTKGVEKFARRYAVGCGLGQDLVEDIALAARLHDLGKCDERFQSWLLGKPFAGTEFLAKSGDNRRLRPAGYPDGARHEMGSVVAASEFESLKSAHDRELVLYLIGVHHGFGRPFFPVWAEDSEYRFAVESDGLVADSGSGHELGRIDSGWVDRFWDLNRKYGYWGLAYLETILRRADCMRSRSEELSGKD